MRTPSEDAEDAYRRAQERVRAAREEWEALGRPILATGSRRQTMAHPILRVMNEAESLADRLRRRITPVHPGPAPTAVVTPSPAARLRASSVSGRRDVQNGN